MMHRVSGSRARAWEPGSRSDCTVPRSGMHQYGTTLGPHHLCLHRRRYFTVYVALHLLGVGLGRVDGIRELGYGPILCERSKSEYIYHRKGLNAMVMEVEDVMREKIGSLMSEKAPVAMVQEGTPWLVRARRQASEGWHPGSRFLPPYRRSLSPYRRSRSPYRWSLLPVRRSLSLYRRSLLPHLG